MIFLQCLAAIGTAVHLMLIKAAPVLFLPDQMRRLFRRDSKPALVLHNTWNPSSSQPSRSTKLSPSTPSSSGSSSAASSAPYVLSPSLSSPNTSPSMSSPAASMCNTPDLVLQSPTDWNQIGNYSPTPQIPGIHQHIADGGSPPPYETASIYDGSTAGNSASQSNTVGDLGYSEPGTSRDDIQYTHTLTPRLVSPLPSPTIRVIPPTEPREMDSIPEHSAPASSPESPLMPSTLSPASLRRPHLRRADDANSFSYWPAGARDRHASPSSPMKGLYPQIFLYLQDIARSTNHFRALSALDNFRFEASNLDTVGYLVYGQRHRNALFEISMDLGVSDSARFQAAAEEDQPALTETLLLVLYSPSDEQAVLALEEDAAQAVLDIIHYALDHALILDSEAIRKARRLMGKLCEKCDKLPSSLIIHGVTQRDEHVSCPGGYGDVFRAVYQGKPVALKYMRVFQDTDQRDIRRRFCREALVWQRLRHVYIVPLIGIDNESFPPSLCLVSPWMKNGTVIKFLSGVGGINRRRIVDRLIREIAQGLAFLHGERVVHGDLRGANILVDNSGRACLTDFGLTVLLDASTSQTRNGAGCTRWMAPETLDPVTWGVQDRPCTTASDMYAFACVCLELYTGNAPFRELGESAVILQVVQGGRPKRPVGIIPDPVWDIMEKCWSHNFVNRPDIDEIVRTLGIPEPVPGMNDLLFMEISFTSLNSVRSRPE
ncbi:kinase-like domain-containing protein [Mycena capillaripes]|nr:kinase-like domain-containing protein [Mycena capillaripes]